MMAMSFYRNSAQRAAQKTRRAQTDATTAATALTALLDRPPGTPPPLAHIDDCVARLQRLRATLRRHAGLVVALDAVCRDLNALREHRHATLDALDSQTHAANAQLRDLVLQRDRLARQLARSRGDLRGDLHGDDTATDDTRPDLAATFDDDDGEEEDDDDEDDDDDVDVLTRANGPLQHGVVAPADAEQTSDADDELASAIGAHPLDITHSRNPASSSASLRDPSGSDGSLDEYDSNHIFYTSPRKQSLAHATR